MEGSSRKPLISICCRHLSSLTDATDITEMSTANQAKDLNTTNIGSTGYYSVSGIRDILFQVTLIFFLQNIMQN